jgi:hypothetical protein
VGAGVRTEIATATLTFHGREPARVEVEALRFSHPQRLHRAIRHLLICWGLAIVAVFIPLLHFVLVPGLLFAGVVMAGAALSQRAKLLHVRGACPACAAPLDTAISGRARDAVSMRCDACGRPLTLELEAASRERLLSDAS